MSTDVMTLQKRIADLEATLRQIADLAEAQSLQTLFTKTVAGIASAPLEGGEKS